MCGLCFVYCFIAIAAVNAVKPPHQIVPGNQVGSSHDSARQLPGADGSADFVVDTLPLLGQGVDLPNDFLPERRKLLCGIDVIPAKELQIFIILFQFSDLFSQHGRKGQGFVLPEGITGAKPQHGHKQFK